MTGHRRRGSLTRRSPGLEEYIEGLSFLYYLDKRELITLAEVQKTLSDEETGEPVSRTHRIAGVKLNNVAGAGHFRRLHLGNVRLDRRAHEICHKW